MFRVGVFAVVTLALDVPVDRFGSKADTASYLATARAMLGDPGAMSEYDQRVFPGYPAMIALLGAVGAPLLWAALAITWLSAGFAAAGTAALFRDVRPGWAMVSLIPHYSVNSTLGMTEAPLLALSVGGLLLARKWTVGRSIAGGVLLGFAGLVRPVACFAVAGHVASGLRERKWARTLTTALVSAAVVASGVAILHAWSGDALRGVRVYASAPTAFDGQLFVWPFKSLLFTPSYYPGGVSTGLLVYIWAHVLLTLAACAILARRVMRSAASDLDVLAFVWLLGNTIFVFCIGSYWGFHHFHRFTIPAMPALFWAFRGVLPRRWYIWTAILAGLFAFAVIGVKMSA